ncbi:tight adherence protein B [Azospirillaceae bacterium]
MPPEIWILLGGGALTLAFAFLALSPGGDADRRFRRRLARVGADREAARAARSGGRSTVVREELGGRMPVLDRLARRFLPRPALLRDRLARTGRAISLGDYVIASFVVGLVVILVAVQFADAPFLAGLGAGVAAGMGIPHMVVGWMAQRRVNLFLEQFPDAIDLICRGIRSGLPAIESIGAVGREMKPPISVEFARIADAVRMGRKIEEGMADVAKRLDVSEFRFLMISMSIQQETGGNLAETLGHLADLLRKRRQLKLKIRAMSAEARASAWILGSLPFLMFGLLQVLSPDYISTLLTDPRGHVLIGIALGMIVFGVVVMAQMIRFDL